MAKQSTIYDPRFEAMIKLLKEARKKAKLTQEELSASLGQHRLYITKIESGDRRVDVLELYEICQKVDISIYEVIEATLDNKTGHKVEENSPDYMLGYSKGYIEGRGHSASEDESK